VKGVRLDQDAAGIEMAEPRGAEDHRVSGRHPERRQGACPVAQPDGLVQSRVAMGAQEISGPEAQGQQVLRHSAQLEQQPQAAVRQVQPSVREPFLRPQAALVRLASAQRVRARHQVWPQSEQEPEAESLEHPRDAAALPPAESRKVRPQAAPRKVQQAVGARRE